MALSYVEEMRRNKETPSLRCYEVLVLVLCNNIKYDQVVNIVDDNFYRAENLYCYWIRSRHNTTSFSWALGEPIRSFSPNISDIPDILDLKEVIQHLVSNGRVHLQFRRVIMAKRIHMEKA
ncbi:hypothetical protein ACET3Z_002842 [Daucus carota]